MLNDRHSILLAALAAAMLLDGWSASAGGYRLVYSFQGGSDGATPDSSLLNIGGALYGTTEEGGGSASCAHGCGTVFAVTSQTGAESVVYSFKNGADGANPIANLIKVGNALYGTTTYGGMLYGTVFTVSLRTGAEKVVYSFKGGNDGAYPSANLINVGGVLYGTTTNGGGSTFCHANGCGSVFKLDPNIGIESVVHAFTGGSDGVYPKASLLKVGAILYGTTRNGGGSTSCSYGCGTVFKLNINTGGEGVVYAFKGGSSEWRRMALYSTHRRPQILVDSPP